MLTTQSFYPRSGATSTSNSRHNSFGELARHAARMFVESDTSEVEQHEVESLLDWMRTARAYLDARTRFDLNSHQYLRELYDYKHNDKAQRMAIVKSGQAGISEYGVSRTLWSCIERAMNVLYILPTIPDVSDFSQMRIATAIESSDEIRASIVAARNTDERRGSDKVMLRRMGNGWLVLRGAQVRKAKITETGNSSSRLKSVPADLVILDEFDEMPEDVEPLALMRLGHSQFKEELYISTPTYPGVGIDKKWNESTRHRWFVRCANGHLQTPSLERLVIEWDELKRPSSWHRDSSGAPFLACAECGAPIDRLGTGEWVAERAADVVGYHISKLFTAQTTLDEILANLQSTDDSKRRQVYNQDLGLPYMPENTGLDEATLDNARRDYVAGVARADVGRACMGVDVGRVLHVIIRARDGDSWALLFAGVVADFDDLHALRKKYKVGSTVIDALPETRSAREYISQRANRRRAWVAYFAETREGTKNESFARFNENESSVLIDRTRALDDVLNAFAPDENERVEYTLPRNVRSVEHYYKHLLALHRITEKTARGVVVPRYISGGDDHFALAELYCRVAQQAPRIPAPAIAQGVARGW